MATKYADDVAEIIEHIKQQGRTLMAFIIESLQSCGGQVVIPPTYMAKVHKHVRDAGGLFIADEVQSGFGRSGSKFWAFQLQDGVVPDIVTMGKPMGNGFPVSALATRPEIANRFCSGGMQYFNTYGGNPVSCAAVMSVLSIMEKQGYQDNAANVGSYFLTKLRELQSRFPVIGDVRGIGLFIGIDLVSDRKTREPIAGDAVKSIMYSLKRRGILLNNEGPFGNVIKIKPPMCFMRDNVDEVCLNFEQVLHDMGYGSTKPDDNNAASAGVTSDSSVSPTKRMKLQSTVHGSSATLNGGPKTKR